MYGVEIKGKDSFFSNFKGLLIILVVLGHLIAASVIHKGVMGGYCYKFIYSFHMAAFLFVSGYFSKNVLKGYSQAVEKYLMPYIFMNMSTALFSLLLFKKFSLSFFQPNWASWYLLTVFFYKILLPHILRIRYIFPLSVVVSLLIGLCEDRLSFMSISRTISFLPFFLGGYYCDNEIISKIRNKFDDFVVLAGISYCVIFFYVVKNVKTNEIFRFRYSYKSMNLSNFEGILFHALIIILSCIVIFLCIKYISKQRTMLAEIGEKSLSIYIFHSIFVFIARKYGFLSTKTNWDYILILGYLVLIVYFLSRNKVNIILNNILKRFSDAIMVKT